MLNCINWPSAEEMNEFKTWTALYEFLGIPKNYAAKKKKVQEYVGRNYPSCSLNVRYHNRGKVSDEIFTDIVSRCETWRQVLVECGYGPNGSRHTMAKDRAHRLSLNTDHFTGMAYSKGKTFPRRSTGRSLESYLNNEYPIQSYVLKKKLLKSGIKEHQCEQCGIREWMGEPAPIHLDHINGNRYDNRLDNLRILCPNCHAQTSTYAGKNIKRKTIPIPPCPHCGGAKAHRDRMTCGDGKCLTSHYLEKTKKDPSARKPTKIAWPTTEELSEMVWSKSLSSLAVELGVSDNAIRKRCKGLGIELPPMGHWAKKYWETKSK